MRTNTQPSHYLLRYLRISMHVPDFRNNLPCNWVSATLHVAITSADFSKTRQGVPTGLPLLHSHTVCLSVSHSSPHEYTQHSLPCVLTSTAETLAAPAAGLSVTRSCLHCPVSGVTQFAKCSIHQHYTGLLKWQAVHRNDPETESCINK